MRSSRFIIPVIVFLFISILPNDFALAEEQTPEEPTTPVQTPVLTPASISISAKATKQATIVVKWKAVPDASSYVLYRSTKENGKYKAIKKTKKTNFTDKKIHPKKRYYYRVDAVMPNNVIVENSYSSDVVNAKLKIKKSFKVKAYAYTGGGYTKVGKKAQVGRIAVDPRVIKLGTWLYIEGYGIAQACDIGGNIKGKTIDVYKNTESECRQWGVQRSKIYIIGS